MIEGFGFFCAMRPLLHQQSSGKRPKQRRLKGIQAGLPSRPLETPAKHGKTAPNGSISDY
jgi:hypothetical protein